MLSRPLRSVTMIELLIAMVLLTAVILAINNIDTFSRYHVLSADRRAKMQNDVARCLEHITKNAATAVGNEKSYGANTAVYINPDTTDTTTLSFFSDINGSGLRDTSTDYWIAYKLNTSTHTFTYCSHCPNSACATCTATEETLSQNITGFSASRSGPNDFSKGNYVDVSLTGCWNPAAACGTPDNPSVTMSSSIDLPSVSTN